MGLVEVKENSRVVITRIAGSPKTRRKLLDMGLIPGIPVKVIHRSGSNPVVISVMGRQVILGHSAAQHITVR